jgi:hypothetical protein
MPARPSALRDIIAVLLVLASFALPFLPLPGDGLARMKVDFRSGLRAKPQLVSAEIPRSLCTAVAATLDYRDPRTGAFTKVTCRD